MARKKEERAIRAAYRQEKKAKSFNNSDENFVSFNNQLAVMGLTIREVQGDGNCLFRALGDQIEGHARNHLQNRQDVVEYMRRHQKDFEPFIEDNVPFDKHVSNLANAGVYAGNDAIVAFARLHKVTIVIHQMNTSLWQIQGTEGKCTGELHIAYHNGDHYNSVRRLGDDSNLPANIKLGSKNDSENKSTGNKNKSSIAKENAFKTPWQDVYSLDELEQSVVEQTGCQDLDLVRQVLEAHQFDEESTVDYIINFMIMTSNEGEEAFLLEDSEIGISQEDEASNRDVKKDIKNSNSSGGARPKISSQEKFEIKQQQRQHMSNRKRKEMKKQERKKNSEERKKNKTELSFSESDDNVEAIVVKNLDCLSI